MNKRLTKVLLGLVGGATFAVTGLAGLASATPSNDPSPTPTGGIEICKASAPAPLAVTGSFAFTYGTGGTNTATVNVPVGSCSPVIQVPVTTGTTEKITEALQPWDAVTSITELPGQSYLGVTSLSGGSADVSVTAGAVSEVTYTDQLVDGYIEVCKTVAAGSGETGTFGFTVTGGDSFSTTTSVPVGNCSPALAVPAGTVNVGENGAPDALYVTNIASNPSNDLLSSSLANGTATLAVAAAANASVQTDVTFTNDVVTLKVCKTWEAGVEEPSASPVATYPFSFTSTGLTIPSVSVAPGQCEIVGSYPAGTQVAVTEGIVPGTKVDSITSADGATILPTTSSITGRTVSVVLGETDEGIVTFDDTAADPGELKLCVTGTAAAGSTVSFAVGSTTTVVTQGSCVPVGGVSSPTLFPYNSVQTIVGTASTGNSFVLPTPVVPTTVTEIVGGVPTATTESVQSGTPALSSVSGGTNNVVTDGVVIGENDITEVTFTDPIVTGTTPPSGTAPITITTQQLPPPVSTTGDGTVTVNPPTSTDNGSSSDSSSSNSSSSNTSSGNSSISSGLSVATPAVVPTSAALVVPTVVPTVVTHLTAAQRKAQLVKDEKSLTNVKNAIVRENKLISSAKGKTRSADVKRLNTLKAEQGLLNGEIKGLK
jgi:hypothetical protein